MVDEGTSEKNKLNKMDYFTIILVIIGILTLSPVALLIVVSIF